jgi:Fuc2NAc and GlcNAc transferase
VVAVVVLCVLWLAVAGALSARFAAAFVAGGVVIAGVGWADDRTGMSAGLRMVVHLSAAALAVVLIGGLPAMQLGSATIEPGIAGYLIAVLAIAWSTNAYNFMDGIDGISAVQGVVAGAIGGALLLYDGHRGLALTALSLAGACAGFLPWNRTPARIFLGDVGAGTIGFLFAAIAVASERVGSLSAVGWILLLAPFAADATVTHARRSLRGERVYEAHRSHAYQRATVLAGGHMRVSLAVGALAMASGALVSLAHLQRLSWVAATLTIAAIIGAALLYVERRAPM